jgi:hypothetical protein
MVFLVRLLTPDPRAATHPAGRLHGGHEDSPQCVIQRQRCARQEGHKHPRPEAVRAVPDGGVRHHGVSSVFFPFFLFFWLH